MDHSSPSPRMLWKGRHLAVVSQDRWEYVTRPSATGVVAIVALTDQDNLVLVEQYRPPVQARVVELPAGLTGDRPPHSKETGLAAAQRELLEETGYQAQEWIQLLDACSSPGMTDESITLFLALQLQKIGPGGGESSEDIDVHEVPRMQIWQWLGQQQQRGVRLDLKLLAGLHALSIYQPGEGG